MANKKELPAAPQTNEVGEFIFRLIDLLMQIEADIQRIDRE